MTHANWFRNSSLFARMPLTFCQCSLLTSLLQVLLVYHSVTFMTPFMAQLRLPVWATTLSWFITIGPLVAAVVVGATHAFWRTKGSLLEVCRFYIRSLIVFTCVRFLKTVKLNYRVDQSVKYTGIVGVILII